MPFRYSANSLYKITIDYIIQLSARAARCRSKGCFHIAEDAKFYQTPFCSECQFPNIEARHVTLPLLLSRDILEASHGFMERECELAQNLSRIKELCLCNAYNIMLFLHTDDTSIKINLKHEVIEELLRIIYERCRIITSLTLITDDSFSQPTLDLLILLLNKHSLNITRLSIDYKFNLLDDKFMKFVGDNLISLKTLSLYGLPSITDAGISYLNECSSLEYLDLNKTGIGEKGFYTALNELPKLKVIREHFSENRATNVFCLLIDEEKILDLQLVDLNLHINQTGPRSVQFLPSVLDMTRNLIRLELQIYPNVHIDFSPIASLRYLQQLLIHWKTSHNNFQWMLGVLEAIGQQLTELGIYHCSGLDICAILNFCTNLKILNLSSDLNSTSSFQNSPYKNTLNQKSLQSLLELSLKCTGNFQFVDQETLLRIVSFAENIEKVEIINFDYFSTNFVRYWVQNNTLDYFKHFIVKYCKNFSIESFLELLNSKNPLFRIHIENCGLQRDDIDNAINFVDDQNLDIDLTSVIYSIT